MGGSGGGGSRNFGRPSQPDPTPEIRPEVPPGGGGGGGGGLVDSCQSLDVNTTLQSPKPAIVQTLRKNDILRLTLTAGGPPVTAMTATGKTAGSIVIQDLKKLIDCMRSGNRFVADILEITGGSVKLRVHVENP